MYRIKIGEEEDDNANKSVSYNPCSHLLPFEVEEDFLRQTLKMNSKYTSTENSFWSIS